jgi:hypothetical protein
VWEDELLESGQHELPVFFVEELVGALLVGNLELAVAHTSNSGHGSTLRNA